MKVDSLALDGYATAFGFDQKMLGVDSMTDAVTAPTETKSISKSTHVLVRWIFLRGLGVVYLIAFASVSVQVLGLIGSQGILPAHSYLEQTAQSLGSFPFLFCPTVFWLDSSDLALKVVPAVGALCAFLVAVGIASGPCLIACWLLYLSIVTVGGDFLGFQWDVLLLEVGFLAIFFSHFKLLDFPRGERKLPAPPVVVLWLLRFLLFKLMLSSGLVKLLSGDVTWQDLTALHYHYWTQPLPTPIGWFAAQLPDWFQKLSVGCMFFIELVVPFFIFLPRMFRYLAAFFIVLLQVLILLTGNYTFFNLLTILLCLTLLDDAVILRFGSFAFVRSLAACVEERRTSWMTKVRIGCLVTVVVLLNIGHSVKVAPTPLKYFAYALSPWYLSNGYGLFAVMTTDRKEIIVEGSEDGEKWEPYSFYYKPGDLNRAPPWVAPYQPRLDWQMWFAALGTRRDSPWFSHFVLRLLQGSKDVRALMQSEPFNGRIPKHVRASMYAYEFTDWNELQKTGAWWKRRYLGLFFPDASLRGEADTVP